MVMTCTRHVMTWRMRVTDLIPMRAASDPTHWESPWAWGGRACPTTTSGSTRTWCSPWCYGERWEWAA